MNEPKKPDQTPEEKELDEGALEGVSGGLAPDGLVSPTREYSSLISPTRE